MWHPIRDAAAYGETRYLASKVTVDDRALNRHVLEVLRSELSGLSRPRVLEVGAGIGTMIARLVEWGLLRAADYTALDSDTRLLADMVRWLTAWSESTSRRCSLDDATLKLRDGSGLAVDVRTICADLAGFTESASLERSADLLVAHAFLDLVDVPAVLPGLLDKLEPGGLFWFSVNFDGETIFQPDHPFDARLMTAYHRTMDERVRFGRSAGESKSGRHLFGHLRACGAHILAAGSSDWTVFGSEHGYPAEEEHFLLHILRTIEDALAARPEVPAQEIETWLADRRGQVRSGELVYIAHQLDFVGRRSGSPSRRPPA